MLELSHSPVEAPDELVRRLDQLQLCRPADLRRARASVRRLSRDLPTFDTVWIDALVQLRVLTPYQARILENGDANQLRIGDAIVVNQLGLGPHGTTLLARSTGRRDRVVLKRIHLPIESIPDCRQRLTALLNRAQDWTHPNLVIPQALLVDVGSELVTSSRWIPGLTLAELLVRRGRFPAPIVIEIARQLATGLAALHSQGMIHGDIRLSNVRLTRRGQAVLVDGGIRPATCPDLTIHETLALEAYDGIAPELIGTGIGSNASTEIYALGCLLWQLLTGRAPHSMADPLMKLAAHQTEQIPDVRTLAPDTPVALAESISAMTSAEPNQRPRSFDDLLNQWGRPTWSSRRRLKRYRQCFDGAVPHFSRSRPATETSWPLVAVSLFAISGLTLMLADNGLRNELLAITRRLADVVQTKPGTSQPSETAGDSPASRSSDRELLPLPAASSDGEIVLSEAGPYDVAQVTVTGHLTLRGASGINPVIQIGQEPLALSAQSVTIKNVAVLRRPTPGRSPAALILVKSQLLSVHACLLEQLTSTSEPQAGPQSTLIAWRPLLPATQSSRLELDDTVLRGTGTAVWLAELPHQLTMSNCLQQSTGACLGVSPKAAAQAGQMELNRVTMRSSGPLLRLAGTFAEKSSTPAITIVAQDCVFQPAGGAGLIELQAARLRTDPERAIQMTGQGSVVAVETPLMTAIDMAGRSAGKSIDADESFEGILVSELTFAGPAAGPFGNSRLESQSAPCAAAGLLPGIDPVRLSQTPSVRRDLPK